MTSDDFPIPEPRGDLVPPPRKPPTAIGTATPFPEPSPSPLRSRSIVRTTHRTISIFPGFAGFVASLLNAADEVADSIARELGLRERHQEPTPPADIP